MLTPEGTTVASELVASVGLGSLADRSALRREETAELDRLVGHETFSVTSRGDEPLSPVHIAEIIGLLPDAPPIVVSQRLMELQALARAAARSDIEEYLEWLRMVLNS